MCVNVRKRQTRGARHHQTSASDAHVSTERAESTHRRDREARATVKPVIIAQFVDLDPFPPTRRIRHRLCHDQRLWFALCGVGQVAEDARREIEVLLERELIGREQR